MKRLFFATIMFTLSLSTAHAQSDATATWILSDVQYGDNIGQYLALDIAFGTRYTSINGIIQFEGNTAVNVSGSCFPSGDGVFCNVSAGAKTATILINGSLAGVISISDADGSLSSTGTMTLQGFN